MKNIVKKFFVLVCFIILIDTILGVEQRVYASETDTITTVGDINGDNEINAKDVTMLRRYLAQGWGVTVDEVDADINADGEVNAKDVTMLRRYLAQGWGVELPEKNDPIQFSSNAYVSRNLNMNMYDGNWYHPIYSHLYKEGDYLYRAERDSDGEGKLYIEKYDSNWKLLDTTIVEYGCDYIWGGLHIGELYNFIIIGQTNYSEDNDKTVFKIIKYDKTWDKIDELGIKGANTVEPFSAGTLRCTESNGYLYITTCHKMYTFYDGANHQANVLIVIDEDNMAIIDQVTGIVSGGGYVSHSFNQFIEASSDGGVYRIDQGDGYPRGIVMTKVWKEAYSNITFQKFAAATSESMYDVNKTGAQIAGIKESGEGFAVAYIYDDRGGQAEAAPNYIYVMNIPKELIDKTSNPPIIGLKLYNVFGDAFLFDGPLMCSLGKDNGGIIMWKEKEKKYTSSGEYGYFDEGNICFVKYYPNGAVSCVYSFNGKLSDCEPINVDGKIIWYVTDGEVPEFYELDPEELVIYRYLADSDGNELIYAQPRYDFKISAVAETPNDIIEKDEYETIDNLNSIYGTQDIYRENGVVERYQKYYNGGWRSEKNEYNAANKIIKKVITKSNGDWERKEYRYDDNGKLIYEIDRSDSGSWLSTETEYDEYGKKTREYTLNNTGQFSEKLFNNKGKCIKEHKLNSAGEYLIETEYDENNHRIRERINNGSVEQETEYRYITIEKDGCFKSSEKVISQTIKSLDDGSWVIHEYTYNDNILEDTKKSTYSDGEVITAQSFYDDKDRLIKYIRTSSEGTETGDYSYDEETGAGKCIWTNADGTVETYDF